MLALPLPAGHLQTHLDRASRRLVATVSAEKTEFVRSLGADDIIDYRRVDFPERVRDIELVLEMVGGDYGARSLRTLRPGGLLITLVERTNAELAAKDPSAHVPE